MLEEVTVILSIIACAVSILLYFKSRMRKSLTYLLVSEAPLLETKDQIKHDVKITYQQEEVWNIHLLEIGFLNDGNMPISKQDFLRGISLEFNPEAKILEVRTEDSSPKNLQIWFDRKTRNIMDIKPELLNPKEWFILRILVAEFVNFALNARIAGIETIRSQKDIEIRRGKYKIFPTPGYLEKFSMSFLIFSAGIISGAMILQLIGKVYSVVFTAWDMLILGSFIGVSFFLIWEGISQRGTRR